VKKIQPLPQFSCACVSPKAEIKANLEHKEGFPDILETKDFYLNLRPGGACRSHQGGGGQPNRGPHPLPQVCFIQSMHQRVLNDL
jgi:hypothetical protein